MSTGSTKSNAKRTDGKGKAVAADPLATDLSNGVWRAGVLVVLGIAAVLRLYDLALVPFHHDEGVNGNFLVRLVREGYYQYDPENYHGPTLYYLTAIVSWIIRLFFGTTAADTYGLNSVTIRGVTALFGLGSIVLIFLLRRRLGSIATLAAGLLLAISPGAVYLSRYYIHESLFVFFTFGIVVAGIKFYDDRNLIYLLLASISAAMLFATKETAMISAAVLLIAFGVTHGYVRLLGGATLGNRAARLKAEEGAERLKSFYEGIGGSSGLLIGIGLAVLLFLVVNIIFYSSFFTNFPKGVYDSVKTFAIWTRTGTRDHGHPLHTYANWLVWQESPLLFLGMIGAVFTVLKPKNRFALFAALWSFGLIAAYSLIPYKTPWLALNFIVPLSLIAGYAIQSIYEMDRSQLRLPIMVMVVATIVSGYQSIDLNFFNYDNDDQKYVYVYAHTRRATLQLTKEIDRVAAQHGGHQAGITIVSRDYWPLPWYLRDYKRVGYYGRMSPTTEPIIIASDTQKAEMESQFGGVYQLVPSSAPGGGFELRPGVNLLLYVRQSGSPRLAPPTQ